MTTCTELPPLLARDPSLYFTDEAKRDDRYGMATAKALAQMALRDAAGGTGTQPEPELIAWNLREAGAHELISHLQPNRENDFRPTAANGGDECSADSSSVDRPRRPTSLVMATLRMPVFGADRWTKFKRQFERLACYYHWSDHEKLMHLLTAMDAESAVVLGVAERHDWTYDELVTHLDEQTAPRAADVCKA